MLGSIVDLPPLRGSTGPIGQHQTDGRLSKLSGINLHHGRETRSFWKDAVLAPGSVRDLSGSQCVCGARGVAVSVSGGGVTSSSGSPAPRKILYAHCGNRRQGGVLAPFAVSNALSRIGWAIGDFCCPALHNSSRSDGSIPINLLRSDLKSSHLVRSMKTWNQPLICSAMVATTPAMRQALDPT